MKQSSLPDITRPDANAILVSDWTVGSATQAQATADDFVATRERATWPEELLSINLFGSSDGRSVINYEQWTSAPNAATVYHLYRSRVSSQALVPGCIVIVSVEFDGPDEVRQKRWVDTVFEALEAETELPEGGISGHFHLSQDGRRVLNYAEWIGEEAHRAALEGSGRRIIGKGPKWQEV